MMASLETVLKNNVNLADYGPGLVAVFGKLSSDGAPIRSLPN